MTKTNKQPPLGKGRLRNDVLFIAALVLVVALGSLCMRLFRRQGDTVQVTVDGRLHATYSLAQDRVEDIRTGKQEGQLNRLVIRDGRAYIETATCPDGICAAHRPIAHSGESIVCLPHRVVVTVVTADGGDGPDIVV